MYALLPRLCLFNNCVLALSHRIHKPGNLFLGWAVTRASEKELGAGGHIDHEYVIWSVEGSLGRGLALGTEARMLPTWVQCQRPAGGHMGSAAGPEVPSAPQLAPVPKLPSSAARNLMHSLPCSSGSTCWLLPPELYTHRSVMLWLIPAVG